jgi:glycosyltransferase involved in cell wall biosynthesis
MPDSPTTRTHDFDLVVFPYHDFRKSLDEGFRARDSHWLELLVANAARFRSITIIDRPVSMAESVLLRTPWKPRGYSPRARGLDWALTGIGPNVSVLSHLSAATVRPILLKQGWWRTAFRSARFLRVVALALAVTRSKHPVLLMHHPFGVAIARALPHKSIVFDAGDNFRNLRHFHSILRGLQEDYAYLQQHAREIVAVNEQVAATFVGRRGSMTVLPNGVSRRLFATPRLSHSVPLAHLRRPILGYVGALSKHFDVSLLLDVARALPSFTFLLVGPMISYAHFKALRKLPNVHISGNVHYDAVPALLRDLDICIAPYVFGTTDAQGGESIKLYEYIAAGKPVITTPVAGAERFKQYISVVTSSAEFIAAARNYATHPHVPYPEMLLDGVGWDDRFEVLLEVLARADRGQADP